MHTMMYTDQLGHMCHTQPAPDAPMAQRVAGFTACAQQQEDMAARGRPLHSQTKQQKIQQQCSRQQNHTNQTELRSSVGKS